MYMPLDIAQLFLIFAGVIGGGRVSQQGQPAGSASGISWRTADSNTPISESGWGESPVVVSKSRRRGQAARSAGAVRRRGQAARSAGAVS